MIGLLPVARVVEHILPDGPEQHTDFHPRLVEILQQRRGERTMLAVPVVRRGAVLGRIPDQRVTLFGFHKAKPAGDRPGRIVAGHLIDEGIVAA